MVLPHIKQDAVIQNEVIRGVKSGPIFAVPVGVGRLELTELLAGHKVVDRSLAHGSANNLEKKRELVIKYVNEARNI